MTAGQAWFEDGLFEGDLSAGDLFEGGLFEPKEIGSLPACLVCGARDRCGTDSEGAGWNHHHRLDVATGEAMAAEQAQARDAVAASGVPTGTYWGETVDLGEFEQALFGPSGRPVAPPVRPVPGQVPFPGVTFGDEPRPWNGYHSIICVQDCDGTPDGVACDCPCHPLGAAPPKGVQS